MSPPEALLSRPFGAESRRYLLDRYFADVEPFGPMQAWAHVYRLLMWIDPTTSLAHGYESDKSQPGRHWYARSLAFHAWLSDALGVPPGSLHEEVDQLFRGVIEIAAVAEARHVERLARKAEAQRRGFPSDLPRATGEPGLVRRLSAMLTDHYGRAPTEALVSALIGAVTETARRENKRKNLLGEGFEDVLADVIGRSVAADDLEVHTRRLLHELPGFREPPRGEKPRAVDLAIVSRAIQGRHLATVKWSVRADREEQFAIDLDTYARHESDGQPFDFVFITNEFDAARLVAACTRRHHHRAMFDHVVHVCPEALVAVHGRDPKGKAVDLLRFLEEGRVIGLGAWLQGLTGASAAGR